MDPARRSPLLAPPLLAALLSLACAAAFAGTEVDGIKLRLDKGVVHPATEVCNGIDDDGDGTIDGSAADASCALPHAAAACLHAACAVSSCASGWGDCNKTSADGCETDLSTNVDHCGGCGQACAKGESCVGGLCTPNCGGLTNCSGSCRDLQSDAANCGPATGP